MSEHEVRLGGSGESGSGELPGQEYGEGAGGGPASMDDAVALDEFPEPEGDPVEADDPTGAQEEADALELEWVREELAKFAEPDGSPYDVEDDPADGDYDADDDAEDADYDEGDADAEDYDDADDYEDDAADDGDAEGGYDSAGDGE